jgi:hypothetical protein
VTAIVRRALTGLFSSAGRTSKDTDVD